MSTSSQLLDLTHFSHIPLYRDVSFLQQNYSVEGFSTSQIAKKIFSSREAVRRGILNAGIQIREPNRPHGHPAQPRYGEKIYCGKSKPYIAEQRVINAILGLNAQKLSLRQIASFLDQIGVPTKCRGRKWHPQMIARILAAKCQLTSDNRYHKNTLDNEHQPIHVNLQSFCKGV